MRIHLLALEMSLGVNVWVEEEEGVCSGGRRRTWEDVLPWCSSLPSHGIEMETVGFLPLLSVVCFLSNTQKHIQSVVSPITISNIILQLVCVYLCTFCEKEKYLNQRKTLQNKNYDVENRHMNSNAVLLNNLHCSFWLVDPHPLSLSIKWC